MHTVITARLGRSFRRPVTQKIREVSAGNPFYGLELARSSNGHGNVPRSLPASLAETVRTRISTVDDGVRQALLAISRSGVPTVEFVARAVGTGVTELEAMLADAESAELVAAHRGGAARVGGQFGGNGTAGLSGNKGNYVSDGAAGNVGTMGGNTDTNRRQGVDECGWRR